MVQENTAADILIEDHLWPTLDKVTVDQEREFHKLNRRGSFFVAQIISKSCILKILNTFLQFLLASLDQKME